jgi:hypothetical protein
MLSFDNIIAMKAGVKGENWWFCRDRIEDAKGEGGEHKFVRKKTT